MNTSDKKNIIIAMNNKGLKLALKIKEQLAFSELHAQVNLQKYHLEKIKFNLHNVNFYFENLQNHITEIYTPDNVIIGIMNTAIMIRMIAPIIAKKKYGSQIITIDNDAKFVIPLLEGHNGANKKAKMLASLINAKAIISSSSDTLLEAMNNLQPKFHFEFRDEKRFLSGFSAQSNFHIFKNNQGKIEALKRGEYNFSSLEVQGLRLVYYGEQKYTLPTKKHPEKILLSTKEVSNLQSTKNTEDFCLIIYPKYLHIGAGSIRNAAQQSLVTLIEKTFKKHGLSTNSINSISSIDIKAFEKTIRHAAQYYNTPFQLFSSETLNKYQEQIKNPSSYVYKTIGCHSVSEGAALASSNGEGKLIIEKQKSQNKDVTLAVVSRMRMNISAIKNHPKNITPEQNLIKKLGQIFIVGIGAGDHKYLTNQAEHALMSSEHIVGYKLYLDLIYDKIKNKQLYPYQLGEEKKRVKKTISLATKGKKVALISSGDSGIYAMASLVFEMLENNSEINNNLFDIEVIPGISAMQAASALTGSILGHDFCAISLSNLLTPWHTIKKRLKAACKADFVIALYNPISQNRVRIFKKALKILHKIKGDKVVVLIAKNLGRNNEQIKYIKLKDLKIDSIDMMTIILIGNSESKIIYQAGVKEYIYTPRGYNKKTSNKKNNNQTR